MQQKNQIYWIVLEPYVHVSFANNGVFLYNTMDGSFIESEDENIVELLHNIIESSHGLVSRDSSFLEEKTIKKFILQLREKFMGDIIDNQLSKGNPIQLLPMLNIQNSVERLKKDPERSMGENILTHLHEVLIFLDNPIAFPNKYYPTTLSYRIIEYQQTEKYLTLFWVKRLLDQLSPDKSDIVLNFIMKDIFNYIELDDLLLYLKNRTATKKFTFHYAHSKLQEYLLLLMDANINLDIYIDFPVLEIQFKSIWDIQNQLRTKIQYLFLVYSKEDLQLAEQFIERFPYIQYSIIPIYTGNNGIFFEKNVFISKEDILSQPISMREIFIHQTLNIESFGKLDLMPSGIVYSNLFSHPLGSLGEHSLLEILYNELDLNYSWFKIRNYAPCNNCRYQWLCPSPSPYEVLLNKKNLCHYG